MPLELEFLERSLFVTARVLRISCLPHGPLPRWGVEFISQLEAECAYCRAKYPVPLLAPDADAERPFCPECRLEAPYPDDREIGVGD